MPGPSGGYTDLHSHLVPGVDDGSRTLDDAREGVRRFQEAGVGTIVTTPHLNASLTREKARLRARLDEIDRAWDILQDMVRREFSDIGLHRGQEVMLDIPDPDLSDPRLRLAGTSFVLVEWPGLSVPPSTPTVLDRIVASGFRPVLAHPERYRGLDPEALLAGEWRSTGAILQVNQGSLAGRYGEGPRRLAVTLLERGWVDLLASDFHGRPHLFPYLEEAKEVLTAWGAGYQFDLLARENPSRVLSGMDPVAVAPIVPKKGIGHRIRELFQAKGRR